MVDVSTTQLTDLSQNGAQQDSDLIERRISVMNQDVPLNDIEIRPKRQLSNKFKIMTMEDIKKNKSRLLEDS